jgi:hypothetical protein
VGSGQGIEVALTVADPPVSIKAVSCGDLNRFIQAAVWGAGNCVQGFGQLLFLFGTQLLRIEVVTQRNQEFFTMAALLDGG